MTSDTRPKIKFSTSDQPSTAAGRALLAKFGPTIEKVNELAAKAGAPSIGEDWFDGMAARILAIEAEARADLQHRVELLNHDLDNEQRIALDEHRKIARLSEAIEDAVTDLTVAWQNNDHVDEGDLAARLKAALASQPVIAARPHDPSFWKDCAEGRCPHVRPDHPTGAPTDE